MKLCTVVNYYVRNILAYVFDDIITFQMTSAKINSGGRITGFCKMTITFFLFDIFSFCFHRKEVISNSLGILKKIKKNIWGDNLLPMLKIRLQWQQAPKLTKINNMTMSPIKFREKLQTFS